MRTLNRLLKVLTATREVGFIRISVKQSHS